MFERMSFLWSILLTGTVEEGVVLPLSSPRWFNFALPSAQGGETTAVQVLALLSKMNYLLTLQ